jgi:hypothetical protein
MGIVNLPTAARTKSCGLAIGDFAVTALAYETAIELGVGHVFQTAISADRRASRV